MNAAKIPLWALLGGVALGPAAVPPVAAAEQQAASATTADMEARLKARGLDPVVVARGRVVFDTHCARCHGAEDAGKVRNWREPDAAGNYPAPPLNDAGYAWNHPTEALLESVHVGSPQGYGIMPQWEKKLSERDMRDVVAYIKSLWSDAAYREWMDIERASQEP